MTQGLERVNNRLDTPVKDKNTLESLLAGPNFQAAVKAVLPDHLKPERILKMALVAASRQETLYKCTQASVVKSLMTSAELGLDCSGTLGLGYLVPYWSTKAGGYECQFIPGYRGIIELAKRSNAKFQVEARTVFAGDAFAFQFGTDPFIKHIPTHGERGDITHFYCVTRQPGMAPEFTVMTKGEVDAIRARSNSKDRNGKIVGPWISDYEEMGRKTVTKRHLKYQSLSVEVQNAINVDDEQYQNGHTVAMANEVSQGITGVKERLGLMPPPEPEPIEVKPSNLTDEPDFVASDAHDIPVDADPEPETTDSQLESMRANVASALAELPKARQKDVMAGRAFIKDSTEAELADLLKAIQEA